MSVYLLTHLANLVMLVSSTSLDHYKKVNIPHSDFQTLTHLDSPHHKPVSTTDMVTCIIFCQAVTICTSFSHTSPGSVCTLGTVAHAHNPGIDTLDVWIRRDVAIEYSTLGCSNPPLGLNIISASIQCGDQYIREYQETICFHLKIFLGVPQKGSTLKKMEFQSS